MPPRNMLTASRLLLSHRLCRPLLNTELTMAASGLGTGLMHEGDQGSHRSQTALIGLDQVLSWIRPPTQDSGQQIYTSSVLALRMAVIEKKSNRLR